MKTSGSSAEIGRLSPAMIPNASSLSMRPILTLSLVLATLLPGLAAAGTHTESPDAGIRAATAQFVPGGTDRIAGTLKPGTDGPFGANPSDIDVFAFVVSQTVNAVIDCPTTSFDPNLLLLKEGFFGLYGDDDGGNGLDSRITITLTPGTYYIAVGDNNIGAYPFGATMAGQDAWDNDFGLLDPLTEGAIPIDFIGSESSNPDDSNNDAYEILFNFTTASPGVLDLSAGETSGRLKGRGVTGSRDGRGQTVSLRGTTDVAFLLSLENTVAARTARLSLAASARRLPVRVSETGGGNVTAAFKAGTYTKALAAGGKQGFNLTLSSSVPLRGRKILVTAVDPVDPGLVDTAGAVVTIEPVKKPVTVPGGPGGPGSPRFPRPPL